MELEPCPFCEGEATKYGWRPGNKHGIDHCYIECQKCHIATDGGKEKDVTDAWNRRVNEN